MILVSLLSNKSSTPFFKFEGGDSINHDTALALQAYDPSQNNTNIQYTISPIYNTNNSSSDVSALVDRATALCYQGNNKLAIQYYDKALAIDPHYMDTIYDKSGGMRGLTAWPPNIHIVSSFPFFIS